MVWIHLRKQFVRFGFRWEMFIGSMTSSWHIVKPIRFESGFWCFATWKSIYLIYLGTSLATIISRLSRRRRQAIVKSKLEIQIRWSWKFIIWDKMRKSSIYPEACATIISISDLRSHFKPPNSVHAILSRGMAMQMQMPTTEFGPLYFSFFFFFFSILPGWKSEITGNSIYQICATVKYWKV